jgi:hypothetical protein
MTRPKQCFSDETLKGKYNIILADMVANYNNNLKKKGIDCFEMEIEFQYQRTNLLANLAKNCTCNTAPSTALWIPNFNLLQTLLAHFICTQKTCTLHLATNLMHN